MRKKPVVKLVPVVDAAPTPFLGRGAGIIEATGDLVAPFAPDWDDGADL